MRFNLSIEFLIESRVGIMPAKCQYLGSIKQYSLTPNYQRIWEGLVSDVIMYNILASGLCSMISLNVWTKQYTFYSFFFFLFTACSSCILLTRLDYMSNMMGVLQEAGSAYSPRAPAFTPVLLIFVLCQCLCIVHSWWALLFLFSNVYFLNIDSFVI